MRHLALATSAAILVAGHGQAQVMNDLAPSFDACAQTHGNRDLYIETLLAAGWAVTADRETAIARISDSFLPVLGPSGLPWADMLTARAEAGSAPGDDLVGDRDVYEQDGHVLMIGGYDLPDGDFRVDCWLVLPDDTLTDAVFATVPDQTPLPQIAMAAFAGPPHDDGSVTRIMAVQLSPQTQPSPPLAGANGLYIQTVIPTGRASE